jgi:signal transduction histidine kinase
MGISFDYYSVSLLLGGFTALLSGFLVFFHNRERLENIAWLLSNITSAIWSFGYFATITANSRDFALISDWILHIAAISIPVCYFLSVLSIIGEYKRNKRQLLGFSLIGLFFVIFVSSPLFVQDVIPKAHFNFVPDAGPLYKYFTAYFFLVVLYTLFLVIKKYIEVEDKVFRARLRYIIIFTVLGFGGGGSVFFLTFNVPILPYPLILFSIYPAVSGYAIFRYQLFNVKVITTEILVFLIWIFVLIRTLLSSDLENLLTNLGLLLSLNVAGLVLIRSVIKEVRQREQIEKLAQDLKKANEGQVSLMHFMNHQVKGRFGNAKNIFAELMTNDYGEMPGDAKPLLEKGLEETNMGIDYVQNILNSASAESGKLLYDMKPFDYRRVLEEAFEREKPRAEGKGLKFELNISDGDYGIVGDLRQLSEATRNLIDNSITYTPKGNVSVSLNQDKYAVKLDISDTGVGLTTKDKSSLFKSGGRGEESLKFNVNSTGYGLAFVKGVVDAHKGRVWAESDGRNKGSTFYLELPKTQ